MEKMSDKEREVLKELQAKAKRIEREKKKLIEEAEEVKEELLKKWGIRQTEKEEKSMEPQEKVWKKIYEAYGVGTEEKDGQKRLFEHLVSEQQVSYYRRCKIQ